MIRSTNVVRFSGKVVQLPLADNRLRLCAPTAIQTKKLGELRGRRPSMRQHISSPSATRAICQASRMLRYTLSSRLLPIRPEGYPRCAGQLGGVADYESFLHELDQVWRECNRVLVPGGRICYVVGDVCIPRRDSASTLSCLCMRISRCARVNLDSTFLTPILWHKVANGVTEAEGNGAGFYRSRISPDQLSRMTSNTFYFCAKEVHIARLDPCKRLFHVTRHEMQSGCLPFGRIPGASLRNGHFAPYPPVLAERLIKLFSFAGDTVLDPFGGTGGTAIAAVKTGRNSLSVEIEPDFIELAQQNIMQAIKVPRTTGAIVANLEVKTSARPSIP